MIEKLKNYYDKFKNMNDAEGMVLVCKISLFFVAPVGLFAMVAAYVWEFLL